MKNKNFLKRLSAMITALCIMPPLSTASNIGTVNSANFDVIDIYNSWQEAYRDELISFMNYGSYASKDSSGSDLCSMYEVYDMNEDGVPELFISEGAYHTSTVHAYTFTDGMVKELFYGGEYGSISFVPSKSYLFEYFTTAPGAGRTIDSWFTVYNFDGEKLNKIAEFGDNIRGMNNYFIIDGTEVDVNTYSNEKNKYTLYDSVSLGRNNYFDELEYTSSNIKYSSYFDYYQASEYNGTATTLTIPDTVNGLPVKQLGTNLLRNNSTVKTIYIPASIEPYSDNAALVSTTLESIIVDDNNPYWSSIDGVMYDKDIIGVCKFPSGKKNLSLPASVRWILPFAFEQCQLKQITLPETVDFIADFSFFCCPKLSSITILNSDCDIAYDDTTICNSYSDEGGHYLGVIRGYEGSTAQAFAESQDITFISLGEDPSKVTTTTTTSTTTTPKPTTTTTTSTTTSSTTSTSTTTTTTTTTTASTTTTTVTTTATTLTTTTSTSSTTTPTTTTTATGIVLSGKCGDNLSFSLDSNGKLIIRGKGNPFDHYPWRGSLDVTEVIIENGVTSIGDYEFSDCSNLTSITIPNSVTSIGDRAFMGCSNLTSITIPNSVTSIGNGAFWDCSKLTSITIPNNVTSIDNSAFWGCSNLTSVNIPDSVSIIGNSTFLGCSNLTSITIPNSVTSIGELAFMGCSSLTSVNIPDSVSIIGNSTFLGCDKLTITCYTGSFAEEYAKEHNIPFKEIKGSSLFGDVNNDGSVSIADTVSLQNFLLGRTKTLNNWKNADLCEDNRLDVFDMIVMRRLLIDKIPN